MSNRVEELESQVAELQAAVDGLTEELVETRERLRKLEGEDPSGTGPNEGVNPGRAEDRTTDEPAADGETTPAEGADAPEDGDETAAESESGSGSDGDIIVA